MSKKIYVLEITSGEIDCTVRVNDIVISDCRPEPQKTAQFKLSPYLITGQNVIEFSLGQHEGEQKSKFHIAVLSGEKGTMPGDETIECGYQWSAEISPLTALEEADPEPFVCMSFECPETVNKAWQTAEPLELTPEDELNINQLAQEIFQALKDRDTSKVIERLDLKHTEQAKALGCDEQKLVASTQGFLTHCFSSPAWSIEQPDWSNVQYLKQANNRLFTIKDNNGAPLLAGNTGQQTIEFELSFAKVGSQWQVVL